ncbi:PREDICTED: uncharacterized protein LOC108780573 [Cyphomyrmex costatus]|uniref:uncharacterized protein LOC108780573 n=1 Tax=Cyphomyrmex costatus TaxID=456900 RepID=UPI0008522BCB|nr:PREDICTED: uncharacterized protein LOC108780573 [Cyphomyrmex costatus]
MSGFRIWALHDLSYILPTKTLQHETHVPTNTFKRCLSNFLNSSRKQENVHEGRGINLTTISNNSEPIFTTWMTLHEIATTTYSSRSPTYFLPLPPKASTEITRPEVLKSLIKYEKLLDRNSVSRNKRLSYIHADDLNFVCNDNTMIKSDNVHCDNCTSRVIPQRNQESKINHTIEQESTCTIGKSLDSPSSTKNMTRRNLQNFGITRGKISRAQRSNGFSSRSPLDAFCKRQQIPPSHRHLHLKH